MYIYTIHMHPHTESCSGMPRHLQDLEIHVYFCVCVSLKGRPSTHCLCCLTYSSLAMLSGSLISLQLRGILFSIGLLSLLQAA